VPRPDVPTRPLEELIPARHLRASPPRLPEVPEHEAVRHYTEISLKNHHVDRALYPLGSCTMPAAGAQGELTGVLLMRAYHQSRGDLQRRRVLIPDSAHGTNPATVALAGFEVSELKSNEAGRLSVKALREALDERVAGLMLTNPNTLGVFESAILEISELVHDAGGLMYMDGANLNALTGVARPGDMGYDIVHFNLHKTFSTPHGGGGPGAGPVAVMSHLESFLPVPTVKSEDGVLSLDWDRPRSIGRIHGFYGNFGVLVRAYTYIRMLGQSGLREMAEAAVLNNAYLSARLEDHFPLPYGRGMHESVFSGTELKKKTGVKTLDVAKRLLDYGFHAPTVYFPLIVAEALMTEPTETETKEELDRYADALLSIAAEAESDPELVTGAPHGTPVRRLDEGRAGRELDVRWSFPEG
jgi:glycine dehydrogenase subunit 2